MINKTETKKEFDCVSFVRKERERISKDTQGKSPKEIIEYFRERKKTQANII